MAKRERFNFLLSISNQEMIKKINVAEGLKKEKDIWGERFLPKRVLRSDFLCKYWVWFLVIIFPIFKIPYLTEALLNSARFKKVKYKNPRLFLAASIALERVAENAGVNCDYWLQVPWDKRVEIKNARKLTVYNFTSCIDVISAFIDNIRIVWYLALKRGYKYPSYGANSFSWFLYDKAIRHIPVSTELIFCNHKDPYTPLFDKLPHNNKTLIQHGTEIIFQKPNIDGMAFYKYHSGYGFWVQNMPYKYSSINNLICFTEKEKDAMLMGIVGVYPDKISIVGYSLKDFNENIDGDKAILIIAYYSLYYERESKLISLLQGKGYKIYLKNHPSFSPNLYQPLKEKYDFVLLDGKRFPKVNMVFSYGSTLALEYENLGIPIILYDKIELNKLNEMVDESLDSLN